MFSDRRLWIMFILLVLPALSGVAFSSSPPADPEEMPAENPTGVITLERALALGFSQNPELASCSWTVRAAEARRIQAGLLPNPELEAAIENFGGDNGLEKFDGAETTLQIRQTFELGGKRAVRKQTAELEKETALQEYESRRLEVQAGIIKSFWDVIAAQEDCAIAGEISAVAADAYQVAAERVKSGKVAPIEEIQAQVTMATARIDHEQAERMLETARKRLAATWGRARPEFEKAVADLATPAPPPPLGSLTAEMIRNPDIVRWDTEEEIQRMRIRMADAERIPDLTVAAGPRYFNESDDTAFVMSLSLPVPVFDRNQGATREARSDLAGIRLSRKAAILKAENDLGEAYQTLTASFSTAESLATTAIPAAETAFSAAREGYREGKINYIAVLETRRAYVEVRRQYVSAIADYHKSKADIERLIGREIHEPPSSVNLPR